MKLQAAAPAEAMQLLTMLGALLPATALTRGGCTGELQSSGRLGRAATMPGNTWPRHMPNRHGAAAVHLEHQNGDRTASASAPRQGPGWSPAASLHRAL